MQIAQAYIKARAATPIIDTPDEGFERHSDGFWYPDWATDYIILPAKVVSDNGSFEIGDANVSNRIYAPTIAAGQQENGWVIAFTQGGRIAGGAGWELIGVLAASGTWQSLRNEKCQCFTFANKAEMLTALTTGAFSNHTVYISPTRGVLYMYSARQSYSHTGGYQLFSQPISSSIWYTGTSPETQLWTRDFEWYCSKSCNIVHPYTSTIRFIHERKPITGG